MKKRSLKILLLLILLLGLGTVVSNASINVSSKTVNSGEKVTISVSSSQSLGAYTVSVADNGGLTFVTSTGQEGAGKTVISGSSASGVTSLASFTFQAPNVTEDKTYKVKISASGMETPNLESVPNTTVTANITVKAPNSNVAEEKPSEKTDTSNEGTSGNTNNSSSSKSSNDNLSNLIVSPVDFTGFKASKTSGYSVTVENDVTEVKITAKTQDSKAKVSVSGNKDLKVGKNTVKVLVTAEDGTQKNYTVNVTRKEKKEENTNDEENKVETSIEELTPEENETILTNAEVSNLGLSSLNLVGITSNDITIEPNITPTFDTNVYSYTASVTSDVESIKVDALANRDGVTIEVMGNENLVIGENIVTILLKSENGEEQQTYQIVVTKTEETLGLTHNTKLVQYIILGIGVAIIQLAIIIAVVRIMRNRKKRLEGKVNIIEDDMHEEESSQENLYEKEEKNHLKKEYLDNYNQKDSPKKDSFNGKKNGKRFK